MQFPSPMTTEPMRTGRVELRGDGMERSDRDYWSRLVSVHGRLSRERHSLAPQAVTSGNTLFSPNRPFVQPRDKTTISGLKLEKMC
jgi:hypothetical protein